MTIEVRLDRTRQIKGRPQLSGAAGQQIAPWRRTVRYWVSRLVVAGLTRGYLRIHLVGRDRLPPGPAIYCFNHMSWFDPFVLMAALPFRPRLFFFGPKEEDMHVGGRNRLMSWTGSSIPYKPGKDDLIGVTRRVGDVLDSGAVVAIAGEGRIHADESELWPINEGTAYFALRSHVPIVPVAISGTSWVRFGGRVTVRIGEPLTAEGRPNRAAVDDLTQRTWTALYELVRDAPNIPTPGRFGRWVTELFNDWPEGSREAARQAARDLSAAPAPAAELDAAAAPEPAPQPGQPGSDA
jgi:1-acyl-sn-glycerol-3-phosphate acyltransferase